jgi:hypothetical protein
LVIIKHYHRREGRGLAMEVGRSLYIGKEVMKVFFAWWGAVPVVKGELHLTPPTGPLLVPFWTRTLGLGEQIIFITSCMILAFVWVNGLYFD